LISGEVFEKFVIYTRAESYHMIHDWKFTVTKNLDQLPSYYRLFVSGCLQTPTNGCMLRRLVKSRVISSALLTNRNPVPYHSVVLARYSTADTPKQNLLKPDFKRGQQDKPIPLNFDDVKESFSQKSDYEILRSIIIFKLCGIPWFVKNGKHLLAMSDRILGTKFTNWILKKTFFAHFCAGESADDIQPVIKKLENAGIGAVLDYAAEADIAEADTTRREGVVSARTYDYTGEEECDANAKICRSCIETAGRRPNGFAAIKLTALGKPELLEHLSNVLNHTKRVFIQFCEENDIVTGRITADQFSKGLAAINVTMEEKKMAKLFRKMDVDNSGDIDYVEWINFLDPRLLGGLNPEFKSQGLKTLSEEELKQMNAMIHRLESLAQVTAQLKVRLMVDAEQTYFQPAIDHFVLHLQRKYNREFPLIYNTYQCYLKDSFNRIQIDLHRAVKEKFFFAAKCVRGAYMVQERHRAKDMSYESPIQDALEATHENYHKCVDLILDNIDYADIMIASHNEKTVKHVVQRMQDLGVPVRGGGVFFGQLLGMCDHVSFSLGHSGYMVYKYVPYGPVHEVVPYLLRRAEENSNVLGNAGKEIQLLRHELLRRRLPFLVKK
jgi:proline dehydrogenase